MEKKSKQSSEILISDGLGYRPPLKWAGGKRWLVPHLTTLWLKHKNTRLVEPFCGGIAIALGLTPEKALLNDLNKHAINFYRHIKKGFVSDMFMINDENFFYESRNRFNELIRLKMTNSKEAAELFYYLNRSCYNGLFRVNQKGEFNVPFGKYSKINYRSDFLPYKKVLSNWTFKSTDFEKLFLNSNDFVYADPPYDASFSQYDKVGFSWDDQVRLAEWLAEHAGPVVLSNQATPRVLKLYRQLGYKLKKIDGPRFINSTGDRSTVEEVLATRNM